MDREDAAAGANDREKNAGAADGNEGGPENPLANVDPETVPPGTGQGMFNDPKSDPLWNPALEPSDAPGSQGAGGQGDDDDSRRPETD